MMIQSYQTYSGTRPLEDNGSKVSYNSLTYSDSSVEGNDCPTTFSAESLRLNGHIPPKRRLPDGSRGGFWLFPQQQQPRQQRHSIGGFDHHWIYQPRIRIWFLLSVALSIATILVLTSGALDSEWLENFWELGLSGARAQGMADASIFNNVISHGIDLDKIVTKTPPEGCETTIILMRHCEKGDLRSHCNFNGSERSAYLATLFGHGNERWPAPSRIYALKTGGRGHKKKKLNFREVETVHYISEKLGVHVDQRFKTSDEKKMVREILTSVLNGEQCGEVTLISWKHSHIQKLAQLFGCGPLQGCPLFYKGKEFDPVWQIKYVYRRFHHGVNGTESSLFWDLFGTVQRENFDPLAFSKKAGDYPVGGGVSHGHGAAWRDGPTMLYG